MLARRNLGNFGVRVFFVISGFLITTLLLQELAATKRISLKWFYIRRALRIFPSAYTYIAVIFLLSTAGFVAVGPIDFLHAITYTVNYEIIRPWHLIHLWSLSVEEQFYLLWPMALILLGRRRGLWLAGSVLVLAPIIRTVTYYWIPSLRWSVGASFQTNADALAVGCVLAGTRAWLWGQEWYRRFLSSRMFVLVPVTALLACAVQGVKVFALPFGFTIMNVGIALCIDRCVRYDNDTVGRILNYKPVAFVGVLSYSLYLWQEPFLNRLSNSAICWFPINLILAFTAALCSYYFVEKPFLKLRKRIERSRALSEKEMAVTVSAG